MDVKAKKYTMAKRIKVNIETATELSEYHLRYLPEHATNPHGSIDFDEADMRLSNSLSGLFEDCAVFAEAFGLPGDANAIRTMLGGYGPGTLTNVNFLPATAEQFHPALFYIAKKFQSLCAVIGANPDSSWIAPIDNLIASSGHVIERLGVSGMSEPAFRNVFLEALKWTYPDARKEGSIFKSFKTYKPDIVIPSIDCAVECKLIKVKEGLAVLLDGIIADVKGYEDDSRYRTFYSLFWQVEPHFTQQQLETYFAELEMPDSWRPFLVNVKMPPIK